MTVNGPDCRRRRSSGREESGVTDWQRSFKLTRRETLAGLGASLVGGLSGCLSGPSFPDADVIAGPDNQYAFEPAELTVEVGERVTWGFASAGHNLCCRPADNDRVGLPTDAEGFASYGPDESPDGSFVPRGGTYDHTFGAPGQYDYVCIPHDDLGMTGTIHVD